MKVATLRPGVAPQVVTIATPAAGASLANLAVGIDGSARPVVTWTTTPTTLGVPSGTTTLGYARGAGDGTFPPPVAVPLTTAAIARVDALVQANGGLTVVWSEGIVPGALAVRTADVAPGATAVTATPRLLTQVPSGIFPSVAGALNGRVAVFFLQGAGGKSGGTPGLILRSSSGTWGRLRDIGPASRRAVRYLNAGVDASGRVVILWDDGTAGGTPTRILAARSASSSDPPGTYHQLPQRRGDTSCSSPLLTLSTSGDGLGSWQCRSSPRLARLTAAS